MGGEMNFNYKLIIGSNIKGFFIFIRRFFFIFFCSIFF